MAGLLIVPDGRPVPATVPALNYGDFKRAIHAAEVEAYQKLLGPHLASREFSFVASYGTGGSILLAPPEVVRNRSVRVWRLRQTAADLRYFLAVHGAEPLEER